MSKKHRVNFSKFPWLNNCVTCGAIIFVLALGTAVVSHYMGRKQARREVARLRGEVRKKDDEIFTYTHRGAEFAENRQMKHAIDSLTTRNTELFQNAQELYFARTAANYSFGRFFTANQIAQLNQVIMPYVQKYPKYNQEWYSFIRDNTPLTGRTTIPTFELIVTELGITPDKFMPMGIIMDNGDIFMFNDSHRQELFESYLNETESAFSESDETEPNFDIPENREIHDEYIRNQNKIQELNKRISGNGFIIGNKLAQFSHQRDSLVSLIDKNQQKLR